MGSQELEPLTQMSPRQRAAFGYIGQQLRNAIYESLQQRVADQVVTVGEQYANQAYSYLTEQVTPARVQPAAQRITPAKRKRFVGGNALPPRYYFQKATRYQKGRRSNRKTRH